MFAISNKTVDGRRESRIAQHNVKTVQKLYDLLSYYSTIPDALKKKQALFQQPNGVPVFLKGGPMDKVLFGITVALILAGLSNFAYTFYGMAKKKK